jgi:hypothetical protein
MATENNFLENEENDFDEENLFENSSPLSDYSDTDDDDDDNDFPSDEISLLEDFDDEEENDDDKNKDDENEFDNENEDEDDDENEFSEKELELLNKKLGTDYKSVDDLKKDFKSADQQSEKEKEENEYKVLTNKIKLYENYIAMDDEKLIREQLLSEASQNKLDITNTEVLDEIEEKIQGLIDLNQLKTMADTLRTNLNFQKEKTESSVQKIDDKRTASENEIARKNTDDLQNAFANIFTANEFLGVTVTKEAIQRAYESVRTNKFFDSVNGNQEMIAKFAMFVEYEKEISKTANRPTQSEKTKSAFDFLSGNERQARRSLTQASGSASSGNSKDNLKGFLK